MAFIDNLNFFGFRLKRKSEEEEQRKQLSLLPSVDPTEGRFVTGATNRYYYSFGINDSYNQEDLIKKYREISMYPEIENAIDEIVNEVFFIGDNTQPVDIVLDDLDYNDTTKNKIRKEFENILTILNFSENMYEYFKRWYIDGAIYFNVVIDKDNPSEGIVDLRYVDAMKIKKVLEVKSEKRLGGIVPIPDDYEEFFYFDNKLKIPVDSIVYSTSGLTKIVDSGNPLIQNVLNLSYLHKAIKPFNQLNMLEDAAIIYRISRAPERRVFKIPVGNAPRHKQEQYLNEIMQKFKNKIAYDPATGELRDATKVMSILEDFWIPVPEGTTGADISTLPGGQNLGEINDINYFKKKLYNSLYVPLSRFSDVTDGGGQQTYSARTTEIIREEIKFSKFIQRLRNRFSKIFLQALRIQLVLKGVIDLDDWENNFKNKIRFDFKKDSHFFEFNEAEIVTRRIELASAALQLEGYFSKKYIQKKFLKLSDEEIKEIETDLQSQSKKDTESGFEPSSGFMGGSPSSFESPESRSQFGSSSLIEPEPLESSKEEPETGTEDTEILGGTGTESNIPPKEKI